MTRKYKPAKYNRPRSFRFRPEADDRLKRLAAAHRRSQTQVVEIALERMEERDANQTETAR